MGKNIFVEDAMSQVKDGRVGFKRTHTMDQWGWGRRWTCVMIFLLAGCTELFLVFSSFVTLNPLWLSLNVFFFLAYIGGL